MRAQTSGQELGPVQTAAVEADPFPSLAGIVEELEGSRACTEDERAAEAGSRLAPKQTRE